MGSITVFPPDNEVILFFEEQRALASWFLGDSPRAWSSVEILIQIPTCILKRSTIQTAGVRAGIMKSGRIAAWVILSLYRHLCLLDHPALRMLGVAGDT